MKHEPMIPNPLYCAKCDGRGYLVADAEWEPYAVQCDACAEQKPILIVMRLADMVRVHPQQITGHCRRCGHEVAIFPSGQKAMREHPGIELVCHRCKMPDPHAELAPGAEREPFQTHRRQ